MDDFSGSRTFTGIEISFRRKVPEARKNWESHYCQRGGELEGSDSVSPAKPGGGFAPGAAAHVGGAVWRGSFPAVLLSRSGRGEVTAGFPWGGITMITVIFGSQLCVAVDKGFRIYYLISPRDTLGRGVRPHSSG